MTLPLSPIPFHGLFVTGTDTGVGKTLVACALIRALAARGLRVAPLKPVAAGLQGGRHADVEALINAAGSAAPREWVNPYAFEPAIAPHIAAARAGVTIELAPIAAALRRLAAGADCVVAEGAGGLLVPLNEHEDGADLARALGLPLLLVVGMRLGCLNHALLSCAAARARGLALAGWVANHIDPAMAEADANVAALADRLPAPLVGRIPYLPRPDPAAAAPLLDLGRLKISNFNKE